MIPSRNAKATFDIFKRGFQSIEYGCSELAQPIEIIKDDEKN